MPRKKQAFINRARARTYQLVHRAGASDASGEQPVLVPVNPVADSSQTVQNESEGGTSSKVDVDDELDLAELVASYSKDDYELGEYGFPDDGYDYSKHFRPIGGGGGVFMDAVTGMPNPDAVTFGSKKEVVGRDGIVLKDEAEEEEEEAGERFLNNEDAILAQRAFEDIQRERKRNKDLDEVFAALDSDGDLDSALGERDEIGQDEIQAVLDGLSGLDELLEDDFVARAEEEEGGIKQELEGVVEQYREPRLLDEQFEKFMRGYELRGSDLEEDEFGGDEGDMEEEINLEFEAGEGDLDELWKDETLLGDLSALKISGEGDDGDGDVDVGDRVREYEEIAHAEFERGMQGLLDSYNRVPAAEVLGGGEGVGFALEALKRAEMEEKQRVEKLDDLGSDEYDSELDREFDEMFADKGEKWDCETILSTYSNLENHPSVIDAPASTKRRTVPRQNIVRLDPRTQAPVDYMPVVGGRGDREEDFGTRRQVVDTGKGRKGESREEKKERKAAAKEAARERRMLKSEMKKAFGTERLKQGRHATAMGKSKVAIQF